MSVSAMAQDSALRLGKTTPSLERMVERAATAAAAAATGGDTVAVATGKGKAAAKQEIDGAAPVPSTPLSELVKYIPTESLTIYVAFQAALGDVTMPQDGKVSDADFSSQWTAVWVMLFATFILTLGLSYRAQKDSKAAKFYIPWFETFAAGAAFVVWAFSLPSTPLRDFAGYDYSAWNSFLILVGTVVIATLAYVLGKSVSWQKIPGSGIS